MKKLVFFLALFSFACKKSSPVTPSPAPIAVVFKLGDVVKWTNLLNPHPGNKMVIKAIYDKTATQPELLTLLDGTVYYSASVNDVIIWNK
ncbi:MAG: hypothetical protein JWR02_1241 [Mucilaginibacter sp.]|nr:hypothetical protein [Mucilaginibacter sp.]